MKLTNLPRPDVPGLEIRSSPNHPGITTTNIGCIVSIAAYNYCVDRALIQYISIKEILDYLF
jgi:hypothetical protein